MRFCSWLFVTSLVLLIASVAHCSKAASYPNPVTDPEACGRIGASRSWICDPEHIITVEQANQLEEVLAKIAEIPTPTCTARQGYQTAIALVSRMRKYGYGGTIEDAKTFAKDLHDAYGVGYDDCQNGIVILLAVGDRHLYISTGRETRLVLDNDKAQAVIDRMKGDLKDGKYFEALEGGLKDVSDILTYGDIQWSWGDYFTMIMIGLVVAISIYFLINGCIAEYKYKECRKKLSKIEKKKANELANKFNAKHCPICLEDFPTDKSQVALLRCGHKFCKECLSQWQRTNANCPVCRDRGTDSDHHDEHKSSEGSAGDEGYVRNDLSTIAFELAMLRSMYPMYITHSMVNTWASPAYTGSFVSHPSFISASPTAATSSRSSFSSSSGWGGGGSGGGGGAGGSW